MASEQFSTQDNIMQSLEIVSERVGDINAAVYERYFADSPGAEALMSHIDHLVRGKMMEEVLRLVMAEDFSGEDEYLSFEMKTHHDSYSVIESMYGSLLNSLRLVVKESAGDDWTDAYERAWQDRIDSLLKALVAHIPQVS